MSIANESRLTLAEASKLLLNSRGEPTSLWTVRRYITDGVLSISRNLVKLEGFKAPAAGLCTSREAIARFIVAMNDTAVPTSNTTSQSVLAAEAELAAAGIN